MLSRHIGTVFSFSSTAQLLVQNQGHSRHFEKSLVKYLTHGQEFVTSVISPSFQKNFAFNFFPPHQVLKAAVFREGLSTAELEDPYTFVAVTLF